MKFTPDRVNAFLEAYKTAGNLLAAAAYVGISDAAIYEWIRRGKAGEPEFKDFYERWLSAKKAWHIPYVKAIQKAADGGTWQAAAWMLERKKSAEYGKRSLDDDEINRRALELASKMIEEAKQRYLEGEKAKQFKTIDVVPLPEEKKENNDNG